MEKAYSVYIAINGPVLESKRVYDPTWEKITGKTRTERFFCDGIIDTIVTAPRCNIAPKLAMQQLNIKQADTIYIRYSKNGYACNQEYHNCTLHENGRFTCSSSNWL